MQITERLISLVAPHNCLQCDKEGSLLCEWCVPDAIAVLPERCYRCKKASVDSSVCQSCRRVSKLRHVWVRTNYEIIAKDLIYKLKFERAQAAASSIAMLMDETLPWLSPDTLVVHVPTASSRYRLRGYDQARLLAQEIARNSNLRHLSLLARVGQSRQVGAKRDIRLKQLENAFRPRHEYLIKGASILLVDDIVTSGGTLEVAAKMLKKAGAKSVDAIVFAQKQ